MNSRFRPHPLKHALDDRLGFLGTSGSGKTFAAGTAVELILKQKSRVIIIDPLGVWWGLRLLANGKTQSPFDVVIFGGQHSDLPLTENAGALIGEAAITMAESCIIDLSQLATKSAERRFMVALLDTIYRKANGEPVHLIVDESDLFAPQRPPKGDETLLHLMEQIVRRGRVKGFIPWLISQRPAVLNKNVLSQVDGLVAFKLTAVQDRDALDSWIEGQADKATGKEIKDSLPTKQIGKGIVWIPGRDILRPATFPMKETFDSSRTPKRGEKIRTRTLKPLNIDALKEKLGQIEADVKSNDPKALKAEVAKLKLELKKVKNDPDAEVKAEQIGYKKGFKRGRLLFQTAMKEVMDKVNGSDLEIPEADEAWFKKAKLVRPETRIASPKTLKVVVDGITLPKAERKILSALAAYDPDGCSKNKVALLAGYAVKGGSFNNALSSLRKPGYIHNEGDTFWITDNGFNVLGPYDDLPIGDELLQYWLSKLGKAEREILKALAETYPTSLSKDELGDRTGYTAAGGSFNNALSKLRTLDLIIGKKQITANSVLFAT